MLFRARRGTRSNRIDAVYHNTGKRDELRGDRPMIGSQTAEVVDLSSIFERALSRHWTGSIDIGTRWNRLHALLRQVDVPVSESGVLLDLSVLGTADSDQDGRHVYVAADWGKPVAAGADRRARLLAGRIHGDFSTVFEGNTPVLGFSLLALPVSHGAHGSVVGSTRSTVLGAAGTVNSGRFEFAAGAYGAWSDLRADTRADAEMQFGLVVNPLRDVRRFSLNVYRLEIKPAWTPPPTCAGSLRIEWYLRQYLVEVEEQGLKPSHPVLKKEEEVRGGRTIGLQLTLSRP